MQKGIDNYHVDVRLSKQFCSDLKILITELIRREIDHKHFSGDTEKAFSPLCRSYLDMMTVLIHRVKTDLTVDEVCFLQFAVAKFILDSVSLALNAVITDTKKQATDLRNQGSMQVLKVQHQLAWMTKHYNSITYHINKQIFDHLHRTEYRQLRIVREQYLGTNIIDFQDFLSNVLMLNRDLNSARFLIEHYINWGGDLEESDFPLINTMLEELMHGLGEDVVKANQDAAVWLNPAYVATPASAGVIASAEAGANPYPMLPYVGLMHSALGDNLAEFLQGSESAEQALADVVAAYTTSAKEQGFLQ